jgi:hypothetical protein
MINDNTLLDKKVSVSLQLRQDDVSPQVAGDLFQDVFAKQKVVWTK